MANVSPPYSRPRYFVYIERPNFYVDGMQWFDSITIAERHWTIDQYKNFASYEALDTGLRTQVRDVQGKIIADYAGRVE